MSRGLSSLAVRLLGAGSIVCCLIVLASFALFVVNQTGAASIHQRSEIAAGAEAGAGEGGSPHARAHRGAVHKLIDEAAETLTSPFAKLTSSRSAWLAELIGTILALLLYGVVARFVMRMLQVRV